MMKKLITTNDEPVKSLNGDRFDIQKYVEGLCEFIDECETPMTIAVQGTWGSGKTSIMKMIEKELNKKLKDEREKRSVWFNTWQFSQFNMQENLSLILINAIIRDLKIEKDSSFKDMEDTIKTLFSWSKSGLQDYMRNKGANKLAEDMSVFLKVDTGLMKLRNQFEKCIDAACNKRNTDRIAIFIDDLDRLEPSIAIEILEVLKNFLDVKNCVFILAVDYDVVINGIKGKYRTNIDEMKGKSFFDKMIQVPFNMPVENYKIDDFVEAEYKKISGDKPDNNTDIDLIDLIESSIGTNPRSIKRLLNSFSLQLRIRKHEYAEEGMGESLNRLLLFAVLCMQLSFEKLYYFLATRHKDISGDLLLLLNGEIGLEMYETYGWKADNELREMLESEQIERIKIFIDKLNVLLGVDNEEELRSYAVDAIERLKKVLRDSSATSIQGEIISENLDYDELYEKFWDEVRPRIEEKKSGEFELRDIYKHRYQDVRAKDRIFSYHIAVLRKRARVVLCIAKNNDEDKALKIYQMLKSEKNKIEEKIYALYRFDGLELNWDWRPNKYQLHIALEYNIGGISEVNDDERNNLVDFVVNGFDAFNKTFTDLVNDMDESMKK